MANCRKGPSRNHTLPDRTSRGLSGTEVTFRSKIEKRGELSALMVATEKKDSVAEG